MISRARAAKRRRGSEDAVDAPPDTPGAPEPAAPSAPAAAPPRFDPRPHLAASSPAERLGILALAILTLAGYIAILAHFVPREPLALVPALAAAPAALLLARLETALLPRWARWRLARSEIREVERERQAVERSAETERRRIARPAERAERAAAIEQAERDWRAQHERDGAELAAERERYRTDPTYRAATLAAIAAAGAAAARSAALASATRERELLAAEAERERLLKTREGELASDEQAARRALDETRAARRAAAARREEEAWRDAVARREAALVAARDRRERSESDAGVETAGLERELQATASSAATVRTSVTALTADLARGEGDLARARDRESLARSLRDSAENAYALLDERKNDLERRIAAIEIELAGGTRR